VILDLGLCGSVDNMVKLLSTAALFGAALAQYNTSSLPTVDLGYEIHQASNFNVGHHTSVM
jgi:hypothetical protein